MRGWARDPIQGGFAPTQLGSGPRLSARGALLSFLFLPIPRRMAFKRSIGAPSRYS
jgi:hypothetical protein